MKSLRAVKEWVVPVVLSTAFVFGLSLHRDAIAKSIGGLYGDFLHVGNRSATPDLTLSGSAESAFVEGTLEVDGAARFDSTIAAAGNYTATAAEVKVSTASSSTRTMSFRGAYTTAQLATLSGQNGDIAWNSTLYTICGSTASTDAADSWVFLSTASATEYFACD